MAPSNSKVQTHAVGTLKMSEAGELRPSVEVHVSNLGRFLKKKTQLNDASLRQAFGSFIGFIADQCYGDRKL